MVGVVAVASDALEDIESLLEVIIIVLFIVLWQSSHSKRLNLSHESAEVTGAKRASFSRGIAMAPFVITCDAQADVELLSLGDCHCSYHSMMAISFVRATQPFSLFARSIARTQADGPSIVDGFSNGWSSRCPSHPRQISGVSLHWRFSIKEQRQHKRSSLSFRAPWRPLSASLSSLA